MANEKYLVKKNKCMEQYKEPDPPVFPIKKKSFSATYSAMSQYGQINVPKSTLDLSKVIVVGISVDVGDTISNSFKGQVSILEVNPGTSTPYIRFNGWTSADGSVNGTATVYYFEVDNVKA